MLGAELNVAIIGHGPSILEADEEEVNVHDVVIKQKQCLGPGRIDVVVGSLNQIYTLGKIWDEAGATPWVFIDSRFDGCTDDEVALRAKGCRYDRPLCDEWNQRYREMRTPFEMWAQSEQKGRASDGFGHRHMSSGLHALLYACHFLSPDVVDLYGYDNVKNANFTWSLTRGKDWNQYPDHRWDIENQMVWAIADHFDIQVHFR